jgi:hypothetical protein
MESRAVSVLMKKSLILSGYDKELLSLHSLSDFG